MAQTNYTPISLYYSATAASVPTAGNLVAGELALNTNDGKLFYKDSSGVVQTLASKAGNVNVSSFSAGSTGLTPSTATTGAVTLAGTLNVSSGGTGLTTLTAGYIPYGNGTSAFGSSANLFWDSANSRLGVGTTSPLDKLSVNGSLSFVSSTAFLYTNGGSGSNVNSGFLLDGTNNVLRFYTNNTEVMRIDSSGNVGIGTSSPRAKLDVNGGAILGTGQNLTWGNVYGAGIPTIAGSASGLDFYPSGSTAGLSMRLDTSGNLGLGVTPSAWNSGLKAIELAYAGDAILSNNINSTGITANAVLTATGWKYGATGYANAMFVGNNGGQYVWYTAPSGTAGNAITFTQAMTLDASGNLGIGTTSPAAALEISRTSANPTINLTAVSNGSPVINMTPAGSGVGAIQVAGAFPLTFYTNSTERMRIDSSGNVMVGTTTNIGGLMQVNHVNNSTGMNVQCTNASFSDNVFQSIATRAASTAFTLFRGVVNNAGTVAINIFGNGNITNINNSYGAISDVKLKENIVDATPKLEDLCKVKVRNYNLKGDYEQHKQIGVVAQELEEVFAGLVEETTDRDAEGNDLGTTTKSVKYSVFVPMLIKAIQEQQALIESLTTRLTALENK